MATEMQSSKLARSKPSDSTQKYLKIAEIKDDTIVLKDGSLRAVIAVSSTNFALQSEEEQNALISGYQNFVNSLDFPIQILIHSRILDINGYLEKLRGLATGQTNELLRVQMNEYIEYVGKLVEYSNIMSKMFYVVIPYISGAAQKETFMGKISKMFNPAGTIVAQQEEFAKAKIKLEERIDHVTGTLGGMGLRSIVLKTGELIELLYTAYNFETASPLHAEALEGIDFSQGEAATAGPEKLMQVK